MHTARITNHPQTRNCIHRDFAIYNTRLWQVPPDRMDPLQYCENASLSVSSRAKSRGFCVRLPGYFSLSQLWLISDRRYITRWQIPLLIIPISLHNIHTRCFYANLLLIHSRDHFRREEPLHACPSPTHFDRVMDWSHFLPREWQCTLIFKRQKNVYIHILQLYR